MAAWLPIISCSLPHGEKAQDAPHKRETECADMTPASQLKGIKLDGGWTVLDLAGRKPNATGGFFSVGYIVQHDDGRKGFLKALDYFKVMEQTNAPLLMQAMTTAYLFELGLCQRSPI